CPLAALTRREQQRWRRLPPHKSKDGSLTYHVRIRRKGQPLQTATFPSLKDAKRWATMIEGQMIEGRHFPTKRPPMTLAEFLVQYRAEILPRKAPSTQREDGYLLRYWEEHLGHRLVAEMTPDDITRHRDALAKTHKPATVLKYLGILSHVFLVALKEYQLLDVNPMIRVVMPPQPRGRLRDLSDDERK